MNPQRWEETSAKKDENTQNQNASPRDDNSSPAKEQDWMENECDESTETGG